jgi:hypothetical protein
MLTAGVGRRTAHWYLSTSGDTYPQLSALTDFAPEVRPLQLHKMPMMLSTKPAKSQYTEVEAAEELGISIEQLRTMIRSHVVDRDEDLNNIPVTTFQPSDLLILRLLAGMPTGSAQRD